MVIADYQGLADVFLRRSRGEPLTAADRELVQTWMETLDHDRAMFAEVLDSTTDSFFGMPRILRGLEGVDSDVEVRPFTSPSPSVVEVVPPMTDEQRRVRMLAAMDEQRGVRMAAPIDEQRRVRMAAAMATSPE